ncbi:beta-ketoacyl synthase [bacterium]|nr:MAG: beta-ketoacyl synthase [bacterium]
MSRLSIHGVGVVGGFGCGVDALAGALVSGDVPVNEVRPDPSDETIRLPAFLADSAPLKEFFNKRAVRRIDHFSRLALLGACLALKDAGLLERGRDRMGVVVATGYGATRTTFAFLDTVIDDGDICASPTHFSNSVHNAAAAHIAIQLQVGGPNLTVSQFDMSVPSALMTARQWLDEGRVDRVLFGAVDEYCQVLGYCWERFFGSASVHAVTPFDFTRQSAIVGEGAAFFVLSQGETGTRYGTIDDIGLSNLTGGVPLLPEKTAFFLGTDGHRQCSASYDAIVPVGALVAAYAPLYGSLPVGQAFDLAIAALAIRDRRIPASPVKAEGINRWKIIGDEKLDERAICCLKADATGNYGLLTIKEDS